MSGCMSEFTETPPCLSDDALIAITERYFGIGGSIQPLASERDQNARISTSHGDYVLKVSNHAEDAALLELQNAVLSHLEAVDPSLGVPRVVAAKDGKYLVMDAGSDQGKLARLLTFLDGRLFSNIEKSPALLTSLGRFMGRLSSAMQSFGHPAAHRPDFLWNLDNALACKAYLEDIVDVSCRAMVARLFARHEAEVMPKLTPLRMAVVHQDANDNNVIVAQDNPTAVAGLIDFGDMTFGRQVNELAVTLAYALMDVPDIWQAATAVIRGYIEAFALSEAEIDVLFDLMRLRLAMSVCISSRRAKDFPDNDYLLVSQQPAFTLLRRLEDVNPAFAGCVFRHAAGHEPVPQHKAIVEWLASKDCHAASLFDIDIKFEPHLLASFKEGAPGMEVADDPHAYSEWLTAAMSRQGATCAIGLYGEDRACYTADAFTNAACPERRSQHLGIDVFLPAGTPLFAPLAGQVFSVGDNAGHLDYGGTVILKHQAGAGGPTFYTLYGHLARKTLEILTEGQRVAAGELIGYLGEPEDNGGWAPHVHFQIMTDMLGLSGNFDGAGEPMLWPVWQKICPDPNLLIGLPPEAFTVDSTPPGVLLKKRKNLLGPSLSIAYEKKLKIVRGEGAYLYDHTGRAFLDGVNNICHVGHCHPRVVEALSHQAGILNTNTRYLHDTILDYAERLTATMPDPLSVVYFVCSGSEANELALRLARTVTGRIETIVLDWAYHGNTGGLIEISPYKFKRRGGFAKPDYVEIAQFPDPYRGPHTGMGEAAGQAYARSVMDCVGRIEARCGHGPAALITESIAGVGGQVIYPEGYLSTAYRAVRAAGGLCIADEVQCGLGRVGKHMWAFELQGVTPDIVSLGKPMGNGHPLAAVVTTPEIAQAFANGMEYFNSFGGNPVSCAVGMAVLDAIEDEGLQAKAYETGEYLKQRFREMQGRHGLIGDVRGEGLFLSIELVRDRETLQPAAEEAGQVVNFLRERSVLLSTDGPYENVLKLKPPMVFGRSEADLLCDRLEAALAAVERPS